MKFKSEHVRSIMTFHIALFNNQDHHGLPKFKFKFSIIPVFESCFETS